MKYETYFHQNKGDNLSICAGDVVSHETMILWQP